MNGFAWQTSEPESEDLRSAVLESWWRSLRERNTDALLVACGDRIVFERYAPSWKREKPHYSASLAKGIVGGLSLMLAMQDGLIHPDDRACSYIPAWQGVELKKQIRISHLASHTSGISNCRHPDPAVSEEHGGVEKWEADFWAERHAARAFVLSRDIAPVLFAPGTRMHYSNPGIAMLSYALTRSLQGAPARDLRSLLESRIMEALGVPASEWSCGYGASPEIDGMTVIGSWGGGEYSANAVARIGRLLLQAGEWQGCRLIDSRIIEAATTPKWNPGAGHYGLTFHVHALSRELYPATPVDAYHSAGAGHQVLLAIPSLKLLAVRFGEDLDAGQADFDSALNAYFVAPLMDAVSA
jgi:CubicO group peptidase (beta-lactamase class C family)